MTTAPLPLAAQDEAGTTRLRRQLGLADGIAIYIGIILGSGIFVAPSAVAQAAPNSWLAVLLWALGGLIAFAGASCYAECGARLPETGGFFVFYRRAYGRPLALVAGWVAVFVTYPASLAGISLVFAQYFAQALGIDSPSPALLHALAVGAVAAAGLANSFGVKTGALAQRLLTLAKVVALVLLCAAALIAATGLPAPAASVQDAAASPAQFSQSPLLLALILVLWTYDGWSDVTLIAGEIKDPGRNLARTVMIGTAGLILLYLFVHLSVTSLLGAQAAAVSQHAFTDAVTRGLGAGAGRVVAALIALATAGAANAMVLTASRIGFAVAQDRGLPALFGRLSRFGTPARSLAVLVAVALVGVFVSDFTGLLALFSFSVWIFYALVAIAVLVLRARRVGEPAGFRAPLGKLAPVCVIGSALVMSGGILVENPTETALGLGLLAVAGGGAWLLDARQRRASDS